MGNIFLKYLFFFAFFSVSQIASAQKNDNKQDNYKHLTLKNNKPWNGSKRDKTSLQQYHNGLLDGLQEIYSEFNGTTLQKTWYTAGILDSVNYKDIYLSQNNHDLKGIYKNGQPWNGYFKKEGTIEQAVKVMEFYKDGLIEKAYSTPGIVQQIITAYRTGQELKENDRTDFIYSATTTYMNGKPYDGRTFSSYKEKGSFYEQYFVNGKLDKIYVGMFAVNSAAIVLMDSLDNGYKISYYDLVEDEESYHIDTQSVRVAFTDAQQLTGNTWLKNNNKTLIHSSFTQYPARSKYTALTPGISKFYFMQNDSLFVTERNILFSSKDISKNGGYVVQRLPLLLGHKAENIESIAAAFEDIDNDTEAEHEGKVMVCATGNSTLFGMYGTDITTDAAGKYYYKTYDENKISAEGGPLTLKQLIKAVKREEK